MGGVKKLKTALTVIGALALVATLFCGVAAQVVLTSLVPGPEPPPGFRVESVMYDAIGRPCYSYVEIGEKPPADVLDGAAMRAAKLYCARLLDRLREETPYFYRRVDAVPTYYPPDSPCVFNEVRIDVYAFTWNIIPMVRQMASVVAEFDPNLARVKCSFMVPYCQYGSSSLSIQELPRIDWDKAAEELKRLKDVKLGQWGCAGLVHWQPVSLHVLCPGGALCY